MRHIFWIALALMCQPSPSHAALVGSASKGEQLYLDKCTSCHAVDENRLGPKHRGVFGRAIGGLTDFDYSKAMKNVTGRWTDVTLDQWLENPEKMLPGNRMTYVMPSAQDRADMIAYLKTISKAVPDQAPARRRKSKR